jgi:tryptophan synthase beta chain
MSEQVVKYLLAERDIPTHWINLAGDLPGDPLPPLHPGTLQPAGPDDLTPIFPMALIEQEVSPAPEIEIPEPVREAYKLWRPTPLYRAWRLERDLDTPAHIYYKYEGVSRERGCTGSPLRRGPGSGAPRWRSRARCSG